MVSVKKVWRRSHYRTMPSGKRVHISGKWVKKPRNVKIGPVKKGTLTKYGYKMNDPAASRHRALKKAIKNNGRNVVMKKVNVLYVWNKNRNKKIAKIAASDKAWIRKNYSL